MAAEMRASWTRSLLDGYERAFSPASLERTKARIAPGALATLEASGPFEWLDASLHLSVLEAPHGVLDGQALRAFWRDHVLDSFERPIFRNVVQGALRLFDSTPLALMKVLPKGFGLVSRGCGTFLVESDGPDATSGRIRIVDMPARFVASEAWTIAWVGTVDAFFALLRTPGEVTVDRSGATRGEIVLDVRWTTTSAVARG